MAVRSPQVQREAAQLRAFVAGAIALALCIVVIAVVLRFPAAPPGNEPRGPLAAAGLADNRLLLLVPGALLVHERSGLPDERIAAEEFGFSQFAPPLWIGADNQVFLNATSDSDTPQLHRCRLDERRCEPFFIAGQPTEVIGLTGSYLGDSLFLLTDEGGLLRSTVGGEVSAEATVQKPWGVPRLLASDGLLFLPAGDGPLLGVYRPDNANFGAQLDALLLMPATAIAENQNRIRDIALSPERRWAILGGDETVAALYAFDRQWGEGQRIALPPNMLSPYLVRWRDKLLVADGQSMRMARFTAEGNPEATFESEMLQQERADWLRVSRERAVLRHLGVGLPLILAALCAVLAALYAASYRALGNWPTQRTALLDPLPAGVQWLPGSAHRDQQIRAIGMALVSLPLTVMLLLAVGNGAGSALVMLPATLASLYAWSALRRGSGGHLGRVDGRFIAVNGDGLYFYGERSLLRGRPRWLLAPTVAVPVSLPLLHNIDALDQTRPGKDLAPATLSSVVELLGILWQMQHPWLVALLATLAGWLLSIAALLLAG